MATSRKFCCESELFSWGGEWRRSSLEQLEKHGEVVDAPGKSFGVLV